MYVCMYKSMQVQFFASDVAQKATWNININNNKCVQLAALERLLPFDNVADMLAATWGQQEEEAEGRESREQRTEDIEGKSSHSIRLAMCWGVCVSVFVAPFDCVNMQKWSHYSI